MTVGLTHIIVMYFKSQFLFAVKFFSLIEKTEYKKPLYTYKHFLIHLIQYFTEMNVEQNCKSDEKKFCSSDRH